MRGRICKAIKQSCRMFGLGRDDDCIKGTHGAHFVGRDLPTGTVLHQVLHRRTEMQCATV